MGRPKGFKLSDEQRTHLIEGKRKAKEKRFNKTKINNQETIYDKTSPVIGFGFLRGDVFVNPIFKSEQNTWKRKIFKTAGEARDALNRQVERMKLQGETNG